MTDTVRVYLNLPPINPKKRSRELTAAEYADSYEISLKRGDGQGISEDEARAVLAQWLINTPRRKRR